jgi:hypothetical protein
MRRTVHSERVDTIIKMEILWKQYVGNSKQRCVYIQIQPQTPFEETRSMLLSRKTMPSLVLLFFFFFFLNETLRRVFPNRFPDVRGRRLSPDLNPRDCFYYDISQTKCSPLTVAQSVIWKRLHKNKWFQSLRKFVSRITEFRFRNWHVISHRRGYTEHLHHEFWMSFLRNLLI